MDAVFIYIVAGSVEEAKKIGKVLLSKRLVSCANIWRISSMYWWKGDVQEGEEFVVLAKTTSEKVGAVEDEVLKIHSYELPCIVWWKVEGHKPYISWIKETVLGEIAGDRG